MNIIEAANLVAEGLLVRRKSWPVNNYMGVDSCGLYIAIHEHQANLQRHFSITVEELLSTDWEMFQARSTNHNQPGLSLKKK